MMWRTVEIVLNLIWSLLVAVGFTVWLRMDRRASANRCIQFVAICTLAFILFPVISVTDDLWAMQNPAELDTSVRRNDTAAHFHVFAPELPSAPTAEFTGIPALLSAYVEVAEFAPRFLANPLGSPLFSRPPPAA